jgi:tRNA A37 threonylcarbamoyladenosine modification protein TsaB
MLACIDARKDEIYAGLFDPNGNPLHKPKAMTLGDKDLSDWINEKDLILVGDGAEKVSDFYALKSIDEEQSNLTPNAKFVAEISKRKLLAGQLENLSEFEPWYMKPVYITQAN